MLKGKYLEFFAGHEEVLRDFAGDPAPPVVSMPVTVAVQPVTVSVSTCPPHASSREGDVGFVMHRGVPVGKTKAGALPSEKRLGDHDADLIAPVDERMALTRTVPASTVPVEVLTDVIKSLGEVFNQPMLSIVHMDSMRPLLFFIKALPKDTITHVARAWPFAIFPLCQMDIDNTTPLLLSPKVTSLFVLAPGKAWLGRTWPRGNVKHVNIVRWNANSEIAVNALHAYKDLTMLIVDCANWAMADFHHFGRSRKQLDTLRLHSLRPLPGVVDEILRMVQDLRLKELVLKFRDTLPTVGNEAWAVPAVRSVPLPTLRRLYMENARVDLGQVFDGSAPHLRDVFLLRCHIIGEPDPAAVQKLNYFMIIESQRQEVNPAGGVVTLPASVEHYSQGTTPSAPSTPWPPSHHPAPTLPPVPAPAPAFAPRVVQVDTAPARAPPVPAAVSAPMFDPMPGMSYGEYGFPDTAQSWLGGDIGGLFG